MDRHSWRTAWAAVVPLRYPSPVLYGYRFVWRDDQGRILSEGTTPITRAAFMFELIQKATDAGWFITAELGAGAGQLKRAQIRGSRDRVITD